MPIDLENMQWVDNGSLQALTQIVAEMLKRLPAGQRRTIYEVARSEFGSALGEDDHPNPDFAGMVKGIRSTFDYIKSHLDVQDEIDAEST